MERWLSFGTIAAQCVAVLALLPVLALRPPETGPMLVVPLGNMKQGNLVNHILRNGGLLLGVGPLRGSLVVYGRRSSLEPVLWRANAVLLAAPGISCGASFVRPEKRVAA